MSLRKPRGKGCKQKCKSPALNDNGECLSCIKRSEIHKRKQEQEQLKELLDKVGGNFEYE